MLVAMVALLASPAQPAFGAYAYDYGRTNGFYYADDCVYAANAAWRALQVSYSYYLGSNFREPTFLTNVGVGDAVYAYTHGSPTAILDNTTGYMTTAEVSARRGVDFKRLVFLDACDTANNATWASAWGIRTGDGVNHTFLGWNGVSWDSPSYCVFTQVFFRYVSVHRSTIAAALKAAETVSGVHNHRYYGTPWWRY